MPISRNLAGTVFVVGGMMMTIAALAYPAMLGLENTSTNTERVISNTSYGPMTEADRDFVVKVRAAGLWEYPLGEAAMTRGASAAMKEAGKHLVVGHGNLDLMCRQIAPELGITLPNQASPQQQQFVATVNGMSGKQFDSTAVGIMRVTHGQIFPVIAKIRASTQNSLIRQLADLANATVLDHMTILEKTELVNFAQNNFQQTAPPKLPEDDTTPPPPQPGAPVLVLKQRPDLNIKTPGPPIPGSSVNSTPNPPLDK